MAEKEQSVGFRVCQALNDMEMLVFRLVKETKSVCRTHHRDSAQLQSSSQRLQTIAQELAMSDVRLTELLTEVAEVGLIAGRVEAAEAAIQTSKQKMFGELAANAKIETQLRELVARVRENEKVDAGRETSRETTVPAASSSSSASASFLRTSSPIAVRDLLRYAKRIGTATALQPNQPPGIYPEAEQMKKSILHHPERFAVKKRRAGDMAKDVHAGGGALRLSSLNFGANLDNDDGGGGAASATTATPHSAAATPVRLSCAICRV